MFRIIHFKKKFFIIGLFLIILGFSLFSYYKIRQNLDVKKHNLIIERDFYNGDPNKYDNLNYIIIPDINVKRIIVPYNLENLNKNYVCLYQGNLDDDSHVILAGHNVKQVFHELHKIKIGSKIIIKGKKINEFIVEDKYTVVKKGDCNGDGVVDTGDTYILKCVILNMKKFDNEYYKKAADINNDNSLDTGDTYILKKQILGLTNIGL